MNRWMSAIVVAGISVAALTGAACVPALAEDPSLVLDRIKASGKFKFPVMGAEEPGYIQDPRTGERRAFFVDCGKDFVGIMGVKIEYYETTWGNLAAHFQAGKIDLAVALNPNTRRGLVVDYVPGAIVEGIWALVARPNFKPKTWREIDTRETRIAVQKGGTMQVIPEAVTPKATIVVAPSRDQAILELQSGKVDAIVIADQDVAFVDAKGTGRAVLPKPALRNPSAIGIRGESGNTGFASLLANWMSQQNSLGLACSRITLCMRERGIDIKAVPQSGKYC
ncbi:ABC transporter substrate-binding protein [Rhizobium mongolense]|uniref:ABC transporter substrate-binding protein n=1 Tax=Rhizobium mongolense TaxID=57676 RepID=UPI003555E1B6